MAIDLDTWDDDAPEHLRKAPSWLKECDGVLLRWCNPNRHGAIALIKDAGDHSKVYWVFHEEPDGSDFEPSSYGPYDEDTAKRRYLELAEEQANTPNWELQREYDEAHGTVNGGDPRITEWEDMHRYEMGDD